MATGARADFLKSIKDAAQTRIKSAVLTDAAASKAEIEQVDRVIAAKYRGGVSATPIKSDQRAEYARNEDGDGFCGVHVNTIEGLCSLLRSGLRPHRGISQEKLPLYLAVFQFIHNARRHGKALLGAFVEAFVK